MRVDTGIVETNATTRELGELFGHDHATDDDAWRLRRIGLRAMRSSDGDLTARGWAIRLVRGWTWKHSDYALSNVARACEIMHWRKADEVVEAALVVMGVAGDAAVEAYVNSVRFPPSS